MQASKNDGKGAIVIETSGLTRAYQTYKKPEGIWKSVQGIWNRQYTEKVALHPTNLSIEGGQIVGLVGANGAGKTTLLKLLSGLIYPSGGTAKVLGHNPWDRSPEYLSQISLLLGQKNQLWWDIPAADSFLLLGKIYDLDPKEAKERSLSLAKMLNCEELLHVQLRRLSLGERMKMEIIGSLLHKPRVLFLDEPTIGLDIVAQTKIREFLIEYVEQESPTIILTSHYMDDISQLADRLLLIAQGQIVYDGTVEAFVNRAETKIKLSLRMLNPATQQTKILDKYIVEKNSVVFSQEVANQDLPVLLNSIMQMGPVQDLKVEETDFEEVIRKFLEKDSRSRAPGDSKPARV